MRIRKKKQVEMSRPILETGTLPNAKVRAYPAAQTISMMEAFTGGSRLADVHNFHYTKRIGNMAHYRASDFQILCLLGIGDAGRVYLVKRSSEKVLIPTGRNETVFALKVCSQHDLTKRNKVNRFFTELHILMTSRHPFIMTLHASFADERNFYLLMEFCNGGEFAEVLKRQPNRCFQESIVQHYAAEILTAFEYLHYHGIIYRDLKTENVLLHHDGHIRLTDFDLAKRLTLGATIDHYKPVQLSVGKKTTTIFPTGFQETTASLVGTPECLPPEVLQGEHSQAADWWTLGIFIYECLYGVTPFMSKGASLDTISKKILRGVFTFPDGPYKVSKKCKDLIKKLLDINPKTRLGSKMGASELKNHPFFKNVNFAIINDPPTIPNINLSKDLGSHEWDVELLKRNFEVFPREHQQMAQDFAGTGAILPKECDQFIKGVLSAYQRAKLPTHPKQVIFDANGDIIDLQSRHETLATGLGDRCGTASSITVSGVSDLSKLVGVKTGAFHEGSIAKLTNLFCPTNPKSAKARSDPNSVDDDEAVEKAEMEIKAPSVPVKPAPVSYLEIPVLDGKSATSTGSSAQFSLDELRKVALSLPTQNVVDECDWS